MGSEHVREVLGRKRTVEILELLATSGPLNYSEIERSIETSSETLSSSLALLGSYGLIERMEASEKDVQYDLTDTGSEFLETVHIIEDLLVEAAD